jgi:L-ribulose-5-phosphate 4-epimerase
MKHRRIRENVCLANRRLEDRRLVVGSWGNVSEIDRSSGVVAIKPSGVAYGDLTVDGIVLVDLDGRPVEGGLRPSSDTPTHLEIYRSFSCAGGICHSHSPYATAWAQACRPIPPLGTTGADYFHGPVPVTEAMTAPEITNDYELNTGRVIVRLFKDLDPAAMPAVLVANHGPFTWGRTAAAAVEVAEALEHTAAMALATLLVNPEQKPIPKVLLDKHYFRKHGSRAYYGQPGKDTEK